MPRKVSKEYVTSCGGIQPIIFEEELTAREKNRIITAINCQQAPEEVVLKSEAEHAYFRIIYEEAKTLYARGGVWPVFDLWELD